MEKRISLYIGLYFLILSLSLLSSPPEQYFREAAAQKEAGSFRASIRLYKKSLSLPSLSEQKKCRALAQLGLLHWNTGQLEESEEFYSRALSLAQKHSFTELQQRCRDALEIYDLYQKGKSHRNSRELQKSIHTFQEAVQLAQKTGSREHQLKCLRQMSVSYLRANDLRQFYNLNKRALPLSLSLNHRKEEGRCLNNIGYYFWKVDDYAQALENYEKALAIARELGNKVEESICLNNIGLIYKNMGNYEKSLDYSKKALEIDRELGNDAYISMDLNNIGEIYRLKGLLSRKDDDFYKALDSYKKALRLAQTSRDTQTEIEVINNIGSLYSHLKKYTQAMEYFQQGYQKAKKINYIEAKGMLLNNMGIVQYNLGNYQRSTRYYQEAIKLARDIENGKILWEAYLEMANAYKKQEKFQKALKSYKDSIHIIENIRRSGIELENNRASFLGTDKRIQAYHNLIDLLLTLHSSHPEKRYDHRAFYYMEKAKARAFLDLMERSKLKPSGGIDIKLENREKELIKDISKLYTKLLVAEASSDDEEAIREELKEKENQLEALKRKIRTQNPAYADFNYPQTLTLQKAQDLLGKHSAFFAYCVGEENSYAFVVSQKELKTFPLPSLEEIRSRMVNYKKVITDKDNSHFQAGYELFCTLVRPGLKKSFQNIIFVPDHILHSFPFETLVTRKDRVHWLVEDHTVSYAPSISSLNQIIQRKRANGSGRKKDLLALGDPYFGQPQRKIQEDGEALQNFYSPIKFNLYRLKYSGREIQKIGDLFEKGKREIFRRKRASKEQLKNHSLDEYKIIHFATHSLIDDQKPARSSIVLSMDQNSQKEAFLHMREIYRLDLNADLVTLSSCQTGLGQLIRGEGIEGLNRAFFYAGSSALLMSLWAVNDQATYQLMERFYTHLRSSQSVRTALRKTKLEMIDSEAVSHPYYWAGFIVSGKADQVIFSSPKMTWVYWGALLLLAGTLIGFLIKKILP